MKNQPDGFNATLRQANILYQFFLGRDLNVQDQRNGCKELLSVVRLDQIKVILSRMQPSPDVCDEDYLQELELMGYQRFQRGD